MIESIGNYITILFFQKRINSKGNNITVPFSEEDWKRKGLKKSNQTKQFKKPNQNFLYKKVVQKQEIIRERKMEMEN
jgi:hypothetical protein